MRVNSDNSSYLFSSSQKSLISFFDCILVRVDAAALKTLNQTVGGVAPYFAASACVLSWKEDVDGDKTVTASLDPSNAKFSLSD